MCGITGIYSLSGERISSAKLHSMTEMLSYRGPDDHGYAVFTPDGRSIVTRNPEELAGHPDIVLGFGHRRLSILDLSSLGHQPMTDAQRQVWITYNGEIYNYLELRTQLEADGYRFRSRSDTEVLLYAYLKWGMNCCRYLNGMWAFAIWDARSQKLFCSRDRFGIKPFYYYFDGRKFIFASEIKAVLEAMPSSPQIYHPILHRYVVHGEVDWRPQTFFQGVEQLMPGHCLVVEDGKLSLEKYWELERQDLDYSEEAAANKFREIFEDAVRLRLRSDVEVGTCLSGGLDSSSVAHYAAKHHPKGLNTFSMIYDLPDFSELEFARIMNRDINAREHLVYPTSKEFWADLPKLIWHMDEPFYNPGVFSQWKLFEEIGRHVRVVLDGQGGDELLGGYVYYFPYFLTASLQEAGYNPWRLLRTGVYAWEIMAFLLRYNRSSLKGIPVFSYLKRILANQISMFLPHSQAKSYASIRGPSDRDCPILEQDIIETYGRELEDVRPQILFSNPLDNILHLTHSLRSLPAMLRYEDKNSMAFSVESRLPFLDYRLVEFVMNLPYNYKIRGSQTKYLMRKSLSGILPSQIMERKDKKGFTTPFDLWFRGEIKKEAGDLLHELPMSRHILNAKRIKEIFSKYCQGQGNHGMEIWNAICIEIWMQQFFRN